MFTAVCQFLIDNDMAIKATKPRDVSRTYVTVRAYPEGTPSRTVTAYGSTPLALRQRLQDTLTTQTQE